jgi:lysophospholipase L1-like esterase
MKIVCLGDSLTYGYGVRRSAVWPRLAAKLSGVSILNRGVNGITTAGMLGSFQRDVIAEGAEAVLLMGGANDILFDLDAAGAETNLGRMAQKALDAGIHTFIGIPTAFCPPIREDWLSMADFTSALPVYTAYIQRLYAFVRERGCTGVDFHAALSAYAEKHGVPLRSLFIDGIHLNEQGHKIFAGCLAQALQKAGVTSSPAAERP